MPTLVKEKTTNADVNADAVFNYTDEHLMMIREWPHLLGHIMGYDKLTPLHSEWILYVWDTDEDRSLQAHRGSYKTTALLGVGSVWWLLFHPDDRIGIQRKTFTDVAKVIRAIKLNMQKPELQALFKLAHGHYPRFTIRKDGALTFNFKTTVTPEGSITGHGLDASLTGTHYDKFLADDIITLKDRTSKAERERTKEVIREVRTNIIDPDSNCTCGFIGTPWHKMDGWTVCPNPRKYNVNETGLLSEEKIAKKKRTTTPSLYAANYELLHVADADTLFKEVGYKRWGFNIPEVYGQLDSAYDGEDTCALTFFARKPDGRIQGVGFSYRGNVKNWIDEIAKYYKKYRCEKLYIENNSDKGYTGDALRPKGITVKDYAEKQNKHIKISTHLYGVWDVIDWDPDTDPEYMEPILDYSKGAEPDDPPDSAAALIREAFTEEDDDELWEL